MTPGLNVRGHPGSRKLPDTDREEECAILGRLVPTIDGRCRPTGTVQLDHALDRGTPLESDAF